MIFPKEGIQLARLLGKALSFSLFILCSYFVKACLFDEKNREQERKTFLCEDLARNEAQRKITRGKHCHFLYSIFVQACLFEQYTKESERS